MRQFEHISLIVAFLVVALCATILSSAHLGTIPVPIMGTVNSILGVLGLPSMTSASLTPDQEIVLWYIRMPRILVGLLVGIALAASGAVLQGMFSNPLADPSILGVSAGASLGAVVAIATGFSAASLLTLPALAFAGAMLSVGCTVCLTVQHGRIQPSMLLLAGVALSILLSACTSGILTFINEYQIRDFLFWMVGSLDNRQWIHVEIGLGPILLGTAILWILARHLNVLSLGDIEAKSLGMPVMVYRLVFLIVTSLITATAVCISGAIGFVGLIVPHMIRLFTGPDHRALIPISALAGGFFLIFCDMLGRIIIAPEEIRVGIMTALIGAPYFLWLLRRLERHGER